MIEFIEQYANHIKCEPSGLTYKQLKEKKIKKIILVDEEGVTE